jgi:Uma2 family endonuclease
MATVTSTAMTVEEFSRLPADGARHEMNAGELITLPPPKSLHSRVARSVFTRLDAFLQSEGLREVYQEAGYLLSYEPPTIRQPDVSVLSKARIDATPEDSYFEGAPELAIEIVSPSDAADELEIKVRQYLNTGAKQVWVLYPKSQDLHVFQPDRFFVLKADEVLEGGDLLPGFAVKVSELFSGSHATP